MPTTDLPDDGAGLAEGSQHVVTDGEVFAAIYPRLYRFAVAVAPPELDPDDLVQDATARALRRGQLVDLDNPAAYLCRTIVNLASNARRRLGRWRVVRSKLVSRHDERIDVDYPSDLDDLLALSPQARAVLWLHDVQGLDFAEVAEILDCSQEAAKSRASRGRQALRQHVQRDQQSFDDAVEEDR